PCRVGGELVALRVAELLDGLEQAEVAFLNQVEQAHAAPGVLLRDRHYEAQVGLNEVLARGGAVVKDGLPVVLKLVFDAEEYLGKLLIVGPIAFIESHL